MNILILSGGAQRRWPGPYSRTQNVMGSGWRQKPGIAALGECVAMNEDAAAI